MGQACKEGFLSFLKIHICKLAPAKKLEIVIARPFNVTASLSLL